MAVRDGRKVVAAAGTAEALSTASVAIRSLVITAETDNTGVVVVGSSTVVAALATRRGTPLAAGATLRLTRAEDGVNDLSTVFVDVMTSGDGVTFTYVTG